MNISHKKSRQRDAVLQCVLSHHDHPTADIIYQELRETFPNISLGTVYRNLSLLTKLGKIQKVIGDDHADRFDGLTHPHTHFICISCGCLLDMSFDLEPDVCEKANQGFEGKITEHSIVFHGYCANCMDKQSNLEK